MSLLYTSVVVPIQLFVWNYDDPCNIFPTLYLDLAVDLFFLVGPAPRRVPCRESASQARPSPTLACECAESPACAASGV